MSKTIKYQIEYQYRNDLWYNYCEIETTNQLRQACKDLKEREPNVKLRVWKITHEIVKMIT